MHLPHVLSVNQWADFSSGFCLVDISRYLYPLVESLFESLLESKLESIDEEYQMTNLLPPQTAGYHCSCSCFFAFHIQLETN